MTTPGNTPEEALVSRIARLEKTVARLNAILLIGALPALAFLGVLVFGMNDALSQVRGEIGGIHGSLRTRGVVIVDENDKVRARIGTDSEGLTEFSILGSPGQARILMGTSSGPTGNARAPDKPQYPYLSVWDENNMQVFSATK